MKIEINYDVTLVAHRYVLPMIYLSSDSEKLFCESKKKKKPVVGYRPIFQAQIFIFFLKIVR